MYRLEMSIWTFLFLFYIYCFLGWCFESIYVSYKEKRWVNRGFMKGPFLPIYGTGAVCILFFTIPLMKSYFSVYFISVVVATLLELVVGFLMERTFKVKYWDYSNNFCNYKGYICLKSSITWGVMGLLITYVINEPFAKFINSLNTYVIIIIDLLISIVFVLDLVNSFKAAYNLSKIINLNNKLMNELNEIKIVIMASIDEKKEEFAEKRANLAIEIKEGIEKALSYTEIDDIILEKIDELRQFDIDEHLKLWRDKAEDLKERIENIDIKNINLLKRNPSAKSRLGFVKEIKERTKRKKK